MRTPNPAHVEYVKRVVARSPFPSLLSMKLVDIGVGCSAISIDLEKKHMQLIGLVHGGVYASLIDTAAWWAAYYGVEEEDAGLKSVDLKLNYLAPTMGGRLLARGRQIKTGRTLCYADVEVTDENGEVKAHGASTIIVAPGKGRFHVDFPAPPKFL
ncbi:MAG: PaaI family thioesterase [Desulfobacterales bacterium]|nr:PaaI family thioesterase [Desulfobacterales bacterium]